MNSKKTLKKIVKLGICCAVGSGLFFTACTEKKEQAKPLVNLTQYVDPFIGTGDHGHVFMGANVPFGLVQAGPVNLSHGWDWCSGYHISDSTIAGFSQMHLSGTGIGDLGDIALMPATGDVKLAKGKPSDYNTGYFSLFSHDQETAKAGHYKVHLQRYDIDVELTATKRVAFHKYIFPESSDAKVIIDLDQGIGWDRPVETYITKENDSVISGYRFSEGWAKDQRIYFTALFSKPFRNFTVSDSTSVQEGTSLKAVRTMGVAQFATQKGEEVYVKVGISPVSVENAKENMKAELPDWNFEGTIAAADLAWNEELNKVIIDTYDPKAMRIFYTAMYHTMIAPSIFSDVNGDYWGTDKKVHKGSGSLSEAFTDGLTGERMPEDQNTSFTNYTTFSLWDTYRAAHPLMTIIHQEKVNDIINTMLNIYKEQGKLPVWHLMANETNCMVGNPAIPVVADAYMKGFNGFDANLAFEAMKNSTMLDERGLKFVKEYGYIPADSIYESVAKGLEYAIADWSIGQVAKKMNKMEDYKYFDQRGKAYVHYFDPETRFMRGKLSETQWRTPFNPFESIHERNDFTEGNAWQYTWLVPQDVAGLVQLLGGEERFIEKLDSLFIVEGDMGDHASPDISGLIGQYAHGNEPSHQVLYMYPYVGQPWKTAEKVRQVLTELYTDKPAGLCGNEDVGQMSAWYILSSLGFYQVNPTNGCYIFGSPEVKNATIHLQDGKTFEIIATDNSKENKYIQSVMLNGQPYTKTYIHYKDIVAGGKLVFQMGDKPSATWGVNPEDRPYSEPK